MIIEPYKKPPITEAVISIVYSKKIDSKSIQKALKNLKPNYSNYQPITINNVRVDIHKNNQAKANTDQQTDHRLSSSDMTEQLIIRDSSFTVSQLAPYLGWDAFLNRFKENYSKWKKEIGNRELATIGVRYINRIDMPITTDEIVEHEKYLNIYPALPDYLNMIEAHSVQTIIPLNDLKCKLRLNSAIVKSPLPRHVSIVVDQDIIRQQDLPQNDDQLFNLLDLIRHKKNEIFESCITDKARGLFS
jgi:uncharacterized protein (TIGR04255 family)